VKILHIVKSEPDDETRRLVDALSDGEDAVEEQLFAGPVNYGELVEKIFNSDKVLCWW